jgi:GLPGLI family protein
MKMIRNLALLVIAFTSLSLQAQKIFTEGTLVYNIAIEADNKVAAMDEATSTILIRGTQSRADMVSTLGIESTINDSKTGNAFILKEYSGQKLMISLTKENWEEKNRLLNDINFETTSQTKIIAGYNCKQAIGKTKSGVVFTVYYTPDVVTVDKEYNIAFKNLPGLPVAYEVNTGKMKFNYTLAKISFDPIPSSKFDTPKSGYRVMTYDENKKIKRGG